MRKCGACIPPSCRMPLPSGVMPNRIRWWRWHVLPKIFRPSGRGIAKRVKDINAVQTETLMDIMEQPDEIVTHVNHVLGQRGAGFADVVHTVRSGIAHCSLVPSLNLCGLSNSRMQQRISELGVRKAFGDARRTHKADLE